MTEKKLYNYIQCLFSDERKWRLAAFIVLGKYFETRNDPIASYYFYYVALDELKKFKDFSDLVDIVKRVSLQSLHKFFQALVKAGLCIGDNFDRENKKFVLSELGRKFYKLLISDIEN